MKRIATTIGAATLLALSGVVSADEPVQLTDTQMDTVTAGGSAVADALANAFGNGQAATATHTFSDVFGVAVFPVEVGAIWLIQSTAVSNAEAIAF